VVLKANKSIKPTPKSGAVYRGRYMTKIQMKQLLFVLASLLMLSACTTKEEEVLSVVNAYESALKTYDSHEAIVYLHPECIAGQYGSEAEYHLIMENAFKKIQEDGGIVATEKGEIIIYENKATVESIIRTRDHQQKGTLELKKYEGKWLISNLP
jgi:hypothetical protein